MTRYTNLLAFACFTLSLISPANAQQLSVQPGEWAYSATGVIGPIPLSESGTECISANEATADLDELLGDVSADCAITTSRRVGNRLTAEIVCRGSLSVKADLEVILDREDVAIEISGSMAADGNAELPVQIIGKANRIGSCAG